MTVMNEFCCDTSKIFCFNSLLSALTYFQICIKHSSYCDEFSSEREKKRDLWRLRVQKQQLKSHLRVILILLKAVMLSRQTMHFEIIPCTQSPSCHDIRLFIKQRDSCLRVFLQSFIASLGFKQISCLAHNILTNRLECYLSMNKEYEERFRNNLPQTHVI